MENTKEKIAFSQEVLVEKELRDNERGHICLVRDRQTNRRYLYRSFAGSGEVYRRMCNMDCRFLPEIYAVEENAGQVRVLEEYIQGDTLAFLLEGKPLGEDWAAKIMLQLCQALKALHSVGAVHRDIKPENILIRGSDAVLIDFDASRVCNAERDMDTRIMGTTGYAAPEQYGFSQTDARADIYAMGVLFNEMLTKEHPSKCLAAGRFRRVIERCIEVNVDKRFADVTQLEQAIQACEKLKKGLRLRSVLPAVALAVVCLAAGWLLRDILPQNRAAMEVNHYEPMTAADQVWEGIAESYETPFRYDLDGDGQLEEYWFGLYHENIPMAPNATMDTFGLGQENFNQRTVYPCVWRYTDDGAPEMVTEFASMLKEAGVTLWRKEGNGSALPQVETAEGAFPGGIRVTYGYDNCGTWLYEVRATLDGNELTALGMSMVKPMDTAE